MSITVSRNNMLQSLPALSAIGSVKMLVSKDQYWLIKTFKKCLAAYNGTNKAAQRKINDLIGEVGEFKKDEEGRDLAIRWIPPGNVEAAKKFEDARDAYLDESVTVDCDRLPMSKLTAAGVELSVEHQASLEWLIDPDM